MIKGLIMTPKRGILKAETSSSSPLIFNRTLEPFLEYRFGITRHGKLSKIHWWNIWSKKVSISASITLLVETKNKKEKYLLLCSLFLWRTLRTFFYVPVFSISMKAIQSAAMCAHFTFRNPELCLSAKGSVTDDSKWPVWTSAAWSCKILLVFPAVFHYLLVWGWNMANGWALVVSWIDPGDTTN